MEPSDCVKCHIAAEEKFAFPYLPVRYRAWLKSEHERLKKLGYPAQAVIDHSEEEMAIFRRFCPPEIVAQIDADHENFHPVLSALADKSLRVPGGMRLA